MLGPGQPGAGGGAGPSFGEPSLGPSVFVALNAIDRDMGQANLGDFNIGNTGGTAETAGDAPVIDGATFVTIGLDFIVTTGDLVFTADGAELFTANAGDNGFDATNSNIFFGGEDGTTFDNFQVTVVPEPTSALLLGLAGFAGLLRRRR